MVKMPRIQKEMLACLQCGYCIDTCEAYAQTPWESVTPRGKIYYLVQLDKKNAMDKLLGRKVTLSEEFVDAMYKCTGCGNCEAVCHANLELVPFWEKIRAWMVSEGAAPLPAHKKLAERIAKKHNPYDEDPCDRDKWWPKDVKREPVPDVIFFAGCTGSYRMQDIPKAGVTVLDRAGVKMNALGDKEWCCTSPALRTGIRDLTIDAAATVVKKADAVGSKDMVMTCSGCFKTISRDFDDFYSKPGQKVSHFTQFADKLIKDKKLPLIHEFNAKVTYHDPCHLGRHSKVFDEPRNILKKIKGIEFVEMDRNRENSRCCGAGGGYKSAFNDYAVNIAAERIKDAEAVGAEVIATACPFCVLNLKAGAKQAGSSIRVMDISQILLQVTEPIPVEVEEAVAEPVAAEPVADSVGTWEPEEVYANTGFATAPVERIAPFFDMKHYQLVDEDHDGIWDLPEDLEYIMDLTPEGKVRRNAWNRGLRCRRYYGEHKIEIAFVAQKVAVYVYAGTPDTSSDATLGEQGWIILRFKEEDITDGGKEADEIKAAVKSRKKRKPRKKTAESGTVKKKPAAKKKAKKKAE